MNEKFVFDGKMF